MLQYSFSAVSFIVFPSLFYLCLFIYISFGSHNQLHSKDAISMAFQSKHVKCRDMAFIKAGVAKISILNLAGPCKEGAQQAERWFLICGRGGHCSPRDSARIYHEEIDEPVLICIFLDRFPREIVFGPMHLFTCTTVLQRYSIVHSIFGIWCLQ